MEQTLQHNETEETQFNISQIIKQIIKTRESNRNATEKEDIH